MPEPGQPPQLSMNGIFPGNEESYGHSLNDPESDHAAEFFGDWLVPDAEVPPAVLRVRDEAQAQFDRYFPGHTERDRHMFMAGVISSSLWFAWFDIVTRNNAMEAGYFGDTIEVDLDHVRAFMYNNTVRLVNLVHDKEDENPELISELNDLFLSAPDTYVPRHARKGT